MLKKPLTLKFISELISAELKGNPDELIFDINRIDNALENQLTFYSEKKYFDNFINSKSNSIIIPNDLDIIDLPKRNYLKVKNPYIAIIQLIKYIDSLENNFVNNIHPTAIISNNSRISEKCYIGPNVIIEDNCKIDDGVYIQGNSFIGENSIISYGSRIYSNVTIYKDTIIGKNCILHSGAVIGADGFGFTEMPNGKYEKIPQIGNVVIGDDCEIGANTCIDRSMIGSTIIGNGVKLDNFVHIGHNCEIGDNTAIAAQTGIAGSTKVGKNCKFGGQVGISGHIEIADGVILYAQSGVAQSINQKGIYIGSPIKDRIRYFKINKSLDLLPEIALNYEIHKNK